MTETHDYLVPDYFPHFSCKMGACRAACCVGWPISLTMQDYFRLLGVECSPDLRRRIDCALHLSPHPTEEAYAQIAPRYDGDCPMRMDDGCCAVHAELGDDALSYVCRLYPRGVRADGDYECSCANSCEAVLEILFKRDKPIAFEIRSLAFNMPKPAKRTVFFETLGREQEIRLYFIKKMQNRSLSMPQRIISLGLALKAMEEALNAKDRAKVESLLNGEAIPFEPEFSPVTAEHLGFGLRAASGMLKVLDDRSQSIRGYGEAALAYFGDGEKAMERYEIAKAHFESIFSKWEIWFEHMLVNHMFFERFPFQNRPESMYDEFIAICAVYSVLRFLGIGCMAEQSDEESFVDVTAAAFRLIDHTEFDRSAAHILRAIDCASPEKLYDLVRL